MLSISLFLVRGWWMLHDSARLHQRWVKMLPHVIDSALLASAVLLALNVGQYPGTHSWLTAKITALLLYIGLGTVALKRGQLKTDQSCCLAGRDPCICLYRVGGDYPPGFSVCCLKAMANQCRSAGYMEYYQDAIADFLRPVAAASAKHAGAAHHRMDGT